MADDKAPHSCGSGYAACLTGRGVTARSSLVGKIVCVGRLVVENVYAAATAGLYIVSEQ